MGIFMDNTDISQKLQEKVYLSLLYDFYGELLKSHNKQIFEDYILNDLSLGEIAQEQGISRQGIYDIVKRCSKLLTDYEEKLGLIHKFDTTRQMAEEIHSLAEELKKEYREDTLEKVLTLSRNMIEVL